MGHGEPERKPYPSDVSDEEWSLVVPYLTLLPLDAKQRGDDLREVSNGLRWWVRSGAQWEFMPHDFPPWRVIYEQTLALRTSCTTCERS